MEDTPTTINGPLHTPDLDASAPKITAIFNTEADASQARDKLAASGVATSRITLQQASDNIEMVSNSQAPDSGILATIRDALLPDEGTAVHRAAVANGRYVLNVASDPSDTETVVGILEACNPQSFDARLERWRNV